MTPQNINTSRLISYGLFIFSGALLITSLMLTMNVQVLKDWKLVVATSDIHAGDTVTIKSEYTKLRDVTGKSTRYIECQNRQHIYVRYPLNEAIANRASGKGGTGIVVKVPTTIPDVPTTCKFTIAIEYDVYPWRKVSISNSSNTFMLLGVREAASSSESQVSTPNSPALNSGSEQGQVSQVVSSSSSNNTPTSTNTQPNNSQPPMDATPAPAEKELEPTPVEERPGIFKRILNVVGL